MSRICFLTTSYPDYPGSYRGGFVRHAALELVDRGYVVSVVTPRIFRRSPCHEQNGGERIERFPFLSEEKLLIQYERIPVIRMVSYILSGVWCGWRAVRRGRCQLIHAHFVVPAGLMAVLVGWLTGKPVIVQAHGSDVTKYAGMNSLLSRLTAFTVRHADHIITVSEPLRNILVEQFAVPGDKITVRSVGVDMNRFKPMLQAEVRQQLRLPPDQRILLFVGALTDYKGGGDLITAVTHLARQGEKFHLLLIGEGPLRQQFINRVHEAGLADRVTFAGVKPNQEMPLWFNAADIFVLPSLREGTPVSLMEALSCERPVVVSRAGGMPQIIQDGENGFLVDIANPAQLAEKLAILLNDVALQQKFSRASRATVTQWGGLKEEVDTLESLYRQLGVQPPEPLL